MEEMREYTQISAFIKQRVALLFGYGSCLFQKWFFFFLLECGLQPVCVMRPLFWFFKLQ
jgi:hypothetical protein